MSAPTNHTAAVAVRVPDMTCGHCVGTITKAVERDLPGASVSADLASHVVTVTGANADAVLAVIREAGYTPEPAGA